MPIRASLFVRIVGWSFLTLAAVGAIIAALSSLQRRIGPESLLFVGDRLEAVVFRLSSELHVASASERRALLQRYSTAHRVDFLLFDERGLQIGGVPTGLPPEVAAFVEGPSTHGGAGSPAILRERTASPSRYWVGVRGLVSVTDHGQTRRVSLLVVSDSMSGHGLFFDPRPWMIVLSAIVLVSCAIWVPFVRGLTRTVAAMTSATERIAEGRFDRRLEVARSDELGRLADAINRLSVRLDGFVGGQRRFLGDISHELNSPLARLDVALGILEDRVPDADRSLVADAQEEVRLLSELVAELLAFAKAGMAGQAIELTTLPLKPIVEAVVSRESGGRAVVLTEVDAGLSVTAQPELLARALANLIRNAVRYAGHAGPVSVSARRDGDHVVITVADRGPGVPAEAIPRLFDPFHRLEPDRDRATGGAGLGLAIVKTCVEACRGTVEARNLSPAGFEVRVVVAAAVGRPGSGRA